MVLIYTAETKRDKKKYPLKLENKPLSRRVKKFNPTCVLYASKSWEVLHQVSQMKHLTSHPHENSPLFYIN